MLSVRRATGNIYSGFESILITLSLSFDCFLMTIAPAKTAIPPAIKYKISYASANDLPLIDCCQLSRDVINVIDTTVPIVCDTVRPAAVLPECSGGVPLNVRA